MTEKERIYPEILAKLPPPILEKALRISYTLIDQHIGAKVAFKVGVNYALKFYPAWQRKHKLLISDILKAL